MKENELVNMAMKKFPKAKRIAVDNLSSGYDRIDTAFYMNLEADQATYDLNTDTIGAIHFVVNQKEKMAKITQRLS